MAVRPLQNSAWGFASSCFVCEPSNHAGLRIPFSHDEDRQAVTARFCLDARFSGAPKLVHGGVVLAVLDEAMAWAAVAVAGRFAVVRRTTTEFRRPVFVDTEHVVEGRLLDHDGERLTARAVVLDPAGVTCAASEASLVVMSPAIARRTIGEVSGSDAAFLGSGKE